MASHAGYHVQETFDNIIQSTELLIRHDDPSQYVSTFAERAALKILKSFGCIFIKGKSGSGKSKIGLKLLDVVAREKSVQPAILTSFRQWNLIPQSKENEPKYVVMIENIFGCSNFVQTTVEEWSRLFDIMWPAVESGLIYLILTSRPEISAQCESRVKKYKLMENIQCITLDSGTYALRKGEKKKLMRMYCGKLTFSDEEIGKAIEVDRALGFPQCCRFFSRSKKAKDKGIQFFYKPYEYITEEVELLQESDPLGYLVLLLVLMNGGHLANTPVRSPKTTHQIETLIDLCSLSSKPSLRAILMKAESLCDVYLQNIDNNFQFHHQSIFDAVFVFVSRVYPDMFLGLCPAKLLVELVKTEIHGSTSNEVVVIVPREDYGILADRITELLLSEDALVVLDHPALHDEEFANVIFEKWKHENTLNGIQTFIMPHQLEIKIGQPVSNKCLFKCKFILPCLLLKQIRKLAHLLTTTLNDDSPPDMLTEILACTVYTKDLALSSMLLNMGASSDECCFRALCGSPYTSEDTDEIVKHILSEGTDYTELKDMFCVAVLKENSLVAQYLFESKLKKKEMTILNQWLESLCELLSNMNDNVKDISESNRTMEDITEKMIETACMSDPEFLLWMAATHPVSIILQHLLKMDLDVNEVFFGSKPLDQALRFGVADNVALLLENGVDICKTKDNTVFHLAAKSEVDSEEKTYILCSYLESCKGVIPTSQEDSNLAEDLEDSENPDRQGDRENHENQEDVEDTDDQEYRKDHDVDELKDQEDSEDLDDEEENENVPDTLETFLITESEDGMPIHSACHADNAGSLRILIQAGADVNIQTAKLETPLHVAVKKRSVECVRLLLQANASADTIDSDMNSPLTCSDKTDFEIVKALVNAGTDVNYSGHSGRTCMTLSLQNDDLDTVRFLCDHGADVNTVKSDGVTVLMVAALHGEIHMVKLLCEKGARLDKRDENGETVLHKAAKSEIDAAEKLLYLLEDPHAPIDIEDNAGRTAVFPAVQSGDIEVIQIIHDKGFDLLKSDKDGNNALHAACKEGVCDFDALSTVFRNSFGHINQQNAFGETVLYLLVDSNISCDLKPLLDRGAKPNIANAKGRTVLHVAVEKQKLELVQLFLQSDGDSCVADIMGMTPLHIASENGNYEMVKLLLKHGSDPNAVNETGRTPVHFASENIHEGCVQELLNEGADPCVVDKKGLSPLHLCVGVNIAMKALKKMLPLAPYGLPVESHEKSILNSRDLIMKMLLENGANPNMSDNEGHCILYVASTERIAESSVKILLEAGADVSALDPDGRSLLHAVAERGTPEVYKLLVDSGANEYMGDQNGKTPLQIITKRKRKSKPEPDPNLCANIFRNMGFTFPQLQPNPYTFGFSQPFFNASHRPWQQDAPNIVRASEMPVADQTDVVSPNTEEEEAHPDIGLVREDRSKGRSEGEGRTIVYQRDESIDSDND
ncbi:uncharacterized protein [Haliotis cracherodii]|uniref:uncharacterized protein n=1 Tax=Haliotis cracherodii TaxID=6455 RepID=UPI0039EC178B